MAWKINLWARLLDGDHAYRIAATLLKGHILTNLYDICPPFQIDGNLGYVSGSMRCCCKAKPRLTRALSVTAFTCSPARVAHGLGYRPARARRVRGDLKWAEGQLTSATIHSLKGTNCRLLYGDKKFDLHLKPNSSLTLDGQLKEQ